MENLNCLYILQQSIYNNEGQWITADSNINMMCGILNQLADYKPNWTFYVLIGDKKDFADLDQNKHFEDLYNRDNVVFIEYGFPVNAFTNRYNFSVEQFKELITEKLPRIDLIWNNIIELSRNIKTVLKELKLEDTKIISCNYWLDAPFCNQEKVPLDISYYWRQIDGAEVSDLCPFTCDTVRKAFIDNTNTVCESWVTELIYEKSTIWDFGYTAKYFEVTPQQKEEYQQYEKPTVLFLNRLSGINYTHHEQFIEAVNALYEERQDFQVIFTNPSQKFSWEWLETNVKPLKIYKRDVLTREEYRDLLAKSHVSCHLFLKELYGGCASRESLAAGNLLITPNVFEYNRILGDDYPLYVNETLSNLKDKINEALNSPSITKWAKYNIIKQQNRKSSYEYNVVQVIQDIENLFN